jgi:hypothetical protein
LQKQDVIKVEEPFESGGLGTLFSFPAMEEEMRQREAEERDRERREREEAARNNPEDIPGDFDNTMTFHSVDDMLRQDPFFHSRRVIAAETKLRESLNKQRTGGMKQGPETRSYFAELDSRGFQKGRPEDRLAPEASTSGSESVPFQPHFH